MLGEAGKHTVQRVPPTESKGRRQTSTCTVSCIKVSRSAVSDILRDEDLKITYQGGSGPGGQHQNRTCSAVRMIHVPTGEQVFINGRKQKANEKEARSILEARVRKIQEAKDHSKYRNSKREQIGGGCRGDKVRVYNFIEGRVKDQRTGKSTDKIKKVMKGQLELIK